MNDKVVSRCRDTRENSSLDDMMRLMREENLNLKIGTGKSVYL